MFYVLFVTSAKNPTPYLFELVQRRSLSGLGLDAWTTTKVLATMPPKICQNSKKMYKVNRIRKYTTLSRTFQRLMPTSLRVSKPVVSHGRKRAPSNLTKERRLSTVNVLDI